MNVGAAESAADATRGTRRPHPERCRAVRGRLARRDSCNQTRSLAAENVIVAPSLIQIQIIIIIIIVLAVAAALRAVVVVVHFLLEVLTVSEWQRGLESDDKFPLLA